MTKPNGLEIAFSGVFLEIDPPHWIKRTERFEAMPDGECIVTLEFAEANGETALTTTMLFENKADRDVCLKSGMELGVKECSQHIDELVATL